MSGAIFSSQQCQAADAASAATHAAAAWCSGLDLVSGLVLGLITLQAGNGDDYIAAMTIDYAAVTRGIRNSQFVQKLVMKNPHRLTNMY